MSDFHHFHVKVFQCKDYGFRYPSDMHSIQIEMSFVRKPDVLNDFRVVFHSFSEHMVTFDITLFEMLHNRYSVWFQVEIKF